MTTKGKRFPVEVLTDPEVQALIRVCSNRAPTGVRNKALIVLLYRSGLRISEALDLAPKDLDADTGAIRVLNGKGNKARTVGLDPGGFAMVSRWLEMRAKRGINGRALLFCTLTGGPMKTAYVRGLLPRLARKAGIAKRVHPHGLRHTFAAQLAAEGVPLNVIQAQLGHANAATTGRYLAHIAPEQVLGVIRKRQWSTGSQSG